MYFVLYFLLLSTGTYAALELNSNITVLQVQEKNQVKTDGVVIFKNKNYGNIGQKVQQKCNQYNLQACNGTLRISHYFSLNSTNLVPFASDASVNTNSPTRDVEKGNEIWNSQNFTNNDNTATIDLPPSYVVGGEISAPKEFPHMALIGYGDRPEIKWLCGGSLISEQYVLSAAHCGSTNAGVAQWVRLGELDLETRTDDADTKDFQIVERILHPEYKPPSLYNDIALFKLKTPVTFNQYIRPICLNIEQNLNVTSVIAAGWGSTGYGEKESSRLLRVDLDIQNDENCDKIYKGERMTNGFNSSTMICAGYTAGGKDTCQGDSGGPLAVNYNGGCWRLYLQIGIVSFGEGCAFPETPAIYTKISYFIPWIESIVWK